MIKRKATLNIDPELHRKLKVEAARRGVKLGEFAEQLLRKGLRREKGAK